MIGEGTIRDKNARGNETDSFTWQGFNVYYSGLIFFYTSPSVNSEMDSVKFLLCLLA